MDYIQVCIVWHSSDASNDIDDIDRLAQQKLRVCVCVSCLFVMGTLASPVVFGIFDSVYI